MSSFDCRATADPDLRFSPYCWANKFALAHKGLPLETVPWRFTEKEAIAFSGQKLVPVIRDRERVVSDSWVIAEYLEDTYPEPALFGSGAARAHTPCLFATGPMPLWSPGSRVASCVIFGKSPTRRIGRISARPGKLGSVPRWNSCTPIATGMRVSFANH